MKNLNSVRYVMFAVLLLTLSLSSCKKEDIVPVVIVKTDPIVKYEKVTILSRYVLSKYPDFVVNYKVLRIAIGVEASVTITNEAFYEIGDTILWSFKTNI